MTSTLTPKTTTRGPSRACRVGALARGELRLLLRNRTAVVNSVLLLLLLVAAVPALDPGGDVPLGPRLLTTAVGVTLIFLTYYNLVATYVARRENLVLQRMRTGELTGPEVLLGTGAPSLLITLGQVVLVAVGVAALREWSASVKYVLPVIALLGGVAVMVVLAARGHLDHPFPGRGRGRAGRPVLSPAHQPDPDASRGRGPRPRPAGSGAARPGLAGC